MSSEQDSMANKLQLRYDNLTEEGRGMQSTRNKERFMSSEQDSIEIEEQNTISVGVKRILEIAEVKGLTGTPKVQELIQMQQQVDAMRWAAFESGDPSKEKGANELARKIRSEEFDLIWDG